MNKVLTNMNQDLSALEKQTARGNIGAEDASNRVTSIDENSTDTQYPSAKCVFNALQNVGGGYKDGGQLVDGDFIKVENNTISSYDNASRDPVNFYFDVANGEVLNSVVELTTAVNATINVYVVKNGFYYLLGNVGGNTVNAGEDYNLNIVGNSFVLEPITPAPVEPGAVVLDGVIYPCKKFGGLLWLTKDFEGSNFSKTIYNGHTYYLPNLNIGLNGWRLPTDGEFISSLTTVYSGNQLKDTLTWKTPGNNDSGFSWTAFSRYYSNWDSLDPAKGEKGAYMKKSPGDVVGIMELDNDGSVYGAGTYAGFYYCVRLVHEL